MRFKTFLSILIGGQHTMTGVFLGYIFGSVAFFYGVIASVFYAGVIMKLWSDGVD